MSDRATSAKIHDSDAERPLTQRLTASTAVLHSLVRHPASQAHCGENVGDRHVLSPKPRQKEKCKDHPVDKCGAKPIAVTGMCWRAYVALDPVGGRFDTAEAAQAAAEAAYDALPG
jgi:hypothetical protein